MTGIHASDPVGETGRAAGTRGTIGGSGGIDDVHRLRRAARRDRQAWPFALVVLGLVVVLATPFYVREPYARQSGVILVSQALGPLADIGAPFTTFGAWAGLYWVVALVLAGLLVAVHYRRVATRRGIAGPLWPVVVAGLVLLVVLLVLTPRLIQLIDSGPRAQLSTAALPAVVTLHLRGLTPLLLVALVLVVLAWTERSPALAAVAAVYLALALVANLYDLENLGYALGLPGHGPLSLLPNLLLPGLFLLGAGGVALVRRRVAG